MEFARKQLEKYGWTDGKGLGKHEDGISQALRPKLKRSMTGVGHDAASDFTEHWWSTLYDKAASNIEVKEKDGKTKKIRAKDDSGFEITNSTWRLKRKKTKQTHSKPREQYEDFFVRTAVLGSGGSRTERVRRSESGSDDDEPQKRDAFKMTDEELFAACEGRTAHNEDAFTTGREVYVKMYETTFHQCFGKMLSYLERGARHGLKALGKLARIEQQERMLLQEARFNGYSHAQRRVGGADDIEHIVENISLDSEEVAEPNKKKKKKKKKQICSKQELYQSHNESGDIMNSLNNSNENLSNEDITKIKNVLDSTIDNLQNGNTDIAVGGNAQCPLKVKKKKRDNIEKEVNGGKTEIKRGDLQSDIVIDRKPKKRKHKLLGTENCVDDFNSKKPSNKKKKKHLNKLSLKLL